MDFADQELITEFVVESQEGLAHVESQMLAIEAAGADIDVDLVNAVFRTMHSIKGAAGFLGLDRIGTLAHGLEELLNNLRNGEIVPTSELISTVLRAADFMSGLINAAETSNEVDVMPYVIELHRLRPGARVEGSDSDGVVCVATPPREVEVTGTSDIILPVGAQLSDTVREFLVECYENLDGMERDLVVLEQDPTSQNVLRNIFRTMHTIKGGAGMLGFGELEQLAHAAEELLGALRDGESELTSNMSTLLLACVDRCRKGLQIIEAGNGECDFAANDVIQQLHREAAVGKRGDAPAVQQHVADVTASAQPAAEVNGPPVQSEKAMSTENTGSAAESTIRVDVALLDKLMTRVGELVLARNQILQYTSRREDSVFLSTAQRLNLITTELQEGVMKTRMQPIGNVWAKFPRIIRDLSGQLGKHVRMEMDGKETELDKTIVEAIKDPLTHLIRNAVDHGIEKPEVRRTAGKSEEGRLSLRAYHEGGQVNIEISDDGAGLNLERIRKKAIERGLVTAEQSNRMSDREASQLILLPGFSTAEQVTSISGRGVGMDVVKTNIERIGGTLDMQSEAGRGTTVRIKIPLTLAIIPALVVTCDGDRYAIPQVSLLELVRLEGEQARQCIEHVHGAPVYRLRGKLLPIVELRRELGVEPASSADGRGVLNIVVLRADDRQFGLIVDSINDTEEIVVKPLSKQLKGIEMYAGSTIMGDGKVALILDVLGAAHRAHVVSEHRDRGLTDHGLESGQARPNRQTLLLVDVGSRRFAMPIALVSRLEEIKRSNVEIADGREVVQYRDTILQLVRLSELLDIPSNDGVEAPMQVLVYQQDDRMLGLVVDQIADIADADIDTQHECQHCEFLFSAVVNGRVTDMLNLPSILRLADGKPHEELVAV